MRVLLLLDDYQVTPFSEAVLDHCERWKPIRQLVMSCVAFGPPGPLEDRLRKVGVGTQSVTASSIRDVLNLKKAGDGFLYRRDRPDLVLAFCRWPAMEARLFHGGNPYVPMVLSTCDDGKASAQSFAVRMAATFWERRTRDRIRRIVVPTMRAKKALLARGISEDSITRIAPGVNAVEAYPLPDHKRDRYRMLMGLGHDVPLVVSVCPLDDPTIDDLIAIMQSVTRQLPDARLFIFGESSRREAVREKIDKAALSSSITLIGAMSTIHAKIFSAADVALHTTADGNGYTLIAEAQACETAVVAYRNTSAEELIIDGQTGLLVERGNHAKAAEAVVALLNDHDRRKTLGADARAFVLEHHEATNSAEKYVRLWQEVAPDADWKTTTGSISLQELNEIKEDAESRMRTPLPAKRSGLGKLS
ncbi:glycosyltransferase [Candidatus Sumerlaeota bacterium]|nr:glycosyltransferase [Candidatus Sumerlaeota bacterium]